MSPTSKYSFVPRLLRRWYWALAALLTAAVWAAVSLAMLPIADRPGSYSSRPYGYTTGLEDSALDLLFQLRDARHKETRTRGLAEPITLIEVDEDSIRASNVRPQSWPRDWYALLIDRASAGDANTIGLDVYLSEAGGISEQDKAADAKLVESLSNAANVVIVQKLPEGGSKQIVPLPEYAEVAWAVGFADLPQEESNLVRSAQLYKQRQGADGKVEVLDSFGSLLAQGYLGTPITKTGELTLQLGENTIPLRNDGNFQIDFRGRAPSFTRVSAMDILCAEFKRTSAPNAPCDPSKQLPDELFRDRIVLIGATNNDAPDLFGSPFYLPNPFPNRLLLRLFDRDVPTVTNIMPGIEVHANIAATLLNGKYLARPSYTRQTLFVLAPLVIVALVLFRFRAVWGLLATLAAGVGILAFCVWAFETRGLILPLASAEVAVLALLAPTGFLLRYAHERAQREEQEAERAAIMDIFSRCVSPEVADKLWLQRDELALGGERRTVTLIFTDIRGFTSLSEGVDSEVVVTWLNEYFSRMHNIVCGFGGHINKFLGDGLMIVFGAPVARGDKLEARAAVSCGLEMLAEVERINRDWEGMNRPHIAIGVGIHTGEATCGVVGAEGRLEYTLIGDTVNLASRLESTTKEKAVPILISSTTAALLGVDYETEPLGDVTVKGKSLSTEVMTVRKASPRPKPVEAETIGV